MTHSGQGEQPSARIPREGIVLPSDGGAPLLPGEQQAPPAVDRSWDGPWGPDPSAAPAAPPAQQWSAPGEHEGASPAPEWGDQGWGTPQPGPHPQAPQQPQAPEQPQVQVPQPPSAQPMPGALPPESAQMRSYGAPTGAPAHPGAGPAGHLPPQTGLPQAGPLPPQAGVLGRQTGIPQQPQGSPPSPMTQGPPLPSAAPAAPLDEGATQYIPPVAAHPGGEAATQYPPPVGPGTLPPEVSGRPQPPSGETRYLGGVPRPSAGPMPAAAPGAAPGAQGNPDAEATQYIPHMPPVPPQQPSPVPPQSYGTGAAEVRREPDVFGSLFRSAPGGEGAAATQQLPRVQAPQPPYGNGTGGRAATRHDKRGERDGKGPRRSLLAAAGVGIAVLGVGAGALLNSGGGDDQQEADKTVATAASTPAESPSPSVDPAEEQAVALDRLLASSGDSRAAVIKAVADIRRCDNLSQAATDLRNAAKQRTDLVTRLSQLSVDKLPNHAALTTALTNAWQASASADNHYAAWADQTAGKKGCREGRARSTGQTQAGNRASGMASAEKTKAASLWNSIASTYGLTQRQPAQL